MHFKPTVECNTTNEEDEDHDEHSINNETPIPEVLSTKFLGVTISFTNDLHKKLKSATGMLKHIRDNIPEEHF